MNSWDTAVVASQSSANPAERYLKRGLDRVDGWLLPGAARLVMEVAKLQAEDQVGGAVAEIGVHEGRFFILLCLLRRSEEAAVAIDVFEQQQLNRDGSGRGDRARLEKNLRRHAPGGRAPIFLSADSRTLSSEELVAAAGSRFRLFSIDGGHEAETVCDDLALAAGALCPGGVIVLDDYFNEGWPGVADGTNRFFAAGGSSDLAAFAIAQNKLLIAGRGHAESYRRRLIAGLERLVQVRESSLFGQPVSYFDFRLGRSELGMLRTLHSAVGRYRSLRRLLRTVGESR